MKIKKAESHYLLRMPKFLMNPVRKLAEEKQKSIKELMRESVEDLLKKYNIKYDVKENRTKQGWNYGEK